MLVRDQAENGLVDVKRSIEAMRKTSEGGTRGLNTIYQLVKTFEKATQLKIVLHIGNLPRQFGTEINFVLYRIVQEGITNAIRHGNATHISIHIELIENTIIVNIQDNGIGLVNIKEGYGLTGMRERIEELKGDLEITSKLKLGTNLRITIPLVNE